MEKRYGNKAEKQKAYRKRLGAKRGKTDFDGGMEVSHPGGASTSPEHLVYDEEKYPNRKAWEIAALRAGRAKKYAAMFPELIKPGDAKYSTIEWQYEHEGLPSVRKPETHLVP